MYGELGRYPLEITVKMRLISYWVNILNSKETKLVNIMYKILYLKYFDESYKSPWLPYVYNVLNANGLGYIWFNQSPNINVNYVKSILKERLLLQFIQGWQSQLEQSSKCTLYRSFKTSFQFVQYLIRIPF